MAKLRGLLGQLRFEIATIDVAEIREKRVNDLSNAIDDLASLAKSAKPEERLRYYQLLGFLCMVLDGVLNNVAKGELLRRLAAVEAKLNGGMESTGETGTGGGRKGRSRKRQPDSQPQTSAP